MALNESLLEKMRKVRNKFRLGAASLPQVEHVSPAGAKLMMGGVLVPGRVVTSNVSSAGVLVGIGNILRIEITGESDVYVAFGASDIGAVDATTSPGLQLEAGYHLVVATDDFVRASANFARLEVIEA